MLPNLYAFALLMLCLGMSFPEYEKVSTLASIPQGDDIVLKMGQVTSVQMPSGETLYSIEYDYDVPGRLTVYIDGLGILPAKGHAAYFTPSNTISIKGSFKGPILKSHTFDVNKIAKGSTGVEFPSFEDFKGVSVTGQLPPNQSFYSPVQTLLQKYFISGHRPGSQPGGINYVVTSYSEWPAKERSRFLEGALLISFPHGDPDGQVRYHLSVLAREKGRMSSQPASSSLRPLQVRARDEFVRQFTNELSKLLGVSQ
jgi:hypothetical protein